METGINIGTDIFNYKVPQYPMPWAVRFDWRYGVDASEVIWTCDIFLGDHIYSSGIGLSQIESLEEAVDRFPKGSNSTKTIIS